MAVPEPDRRPTGVATMSTALLGRVVTMLLVIVLCVGVSYLVVDWRLGQADRLQADQLTAVKQDLETRLTSLDQRIGAFEKLVGTFDPNVPLNKQAAAALLALAQDVEALRGEQTKLTTATNDRLKGLEDSLAKAQGLSAEQASALTGSLQLKALLAKAQNELLSAKIELADQNRGRARDEVDLAVATLQGAKALAGSDAATEIEAIIQSATQARTDLNAGAVTGGDLIQLALHKLGSLITALGK